MNDLNSILPEEPQPPKKAMFTLPPQGQARSILLYPHEALSSPCKPVRVFDGNLHGLIQDMLATMYQGNGVGLAANQMGHDCRVFVADCSASKKHPAAFINPVIISKSQAETMGEGCLSFPGIKKNVKRFNRVRISFMDFKGGRQTSLLEGLWAQCIQHELDHLNGEVFIHKALPASPETKGGDGPAGRVRP